MNFRADLSLSVKNNNEILDVNIIEFIIHFWDYNSFENTNSANP
jgi:hypothetical protein